KKALNDDDDDDGGGVNGIIAWI
ncbi:hypothetical protein Tco_0571953, partial [Tanacetum coccineum]